MRLSDGVEWALHCCTVLGAMPSRQAIPSAVLAEFHGVPPAYLAKQMQALSRAGVVESVAGRHGGYQLARPPEEISMLDVVLAIDGPEPAFRCGEVRQRGPSAAAPATYINPCGIAAAMWRAEAAYREALRATTIRDLVGELDAEITAEQAEQSLNWLAERLGSPQQPGPQSEES